MKDVNSQKKTGCCKPEKKFQEMDPSRLNSRLSWKILILMLLSYITTAQDVDKEVCRDKVGKLLPHPKDCSKFIICAHGQVITQSCSPPMVFDPKLQVCNFKSSTQCKGNHFDDSPPTIDQINKKDYVYQPMDSDSNFRRVRVDMDSDNKIYNRPEGKRGLDEPYYNKPPSANTAYDYSYYRHNPDFAENQYDYAYGYNKEDDRRYQSNQPLSRDPHSNVKDTQPDEGYQTRPFLNEQYNPNQQHYNRNSYRDHNLQPPPGIHDSQFIPGNDGRYQPRETFRPSQNQHEPQQYLRQPGTGPNMFHYVHTELPNPNIYKMVRRPGENFQSLPADVRAPYTESTNTCAYGDGLYADPRDCTSYIQCANGKPYNKQCSPGTYFTSVTSTCAFDQSDCNRGYSRDPIQDYTNYNAPNHREITGQQYDQFPDGNLNPEPKHSSTDTMDMIAIEEFMKNSLVEAKAKALKIIHQEVLAASKMTPEYARPFGGVSSFLGSTPYVKQLSLPAFLQLECLRMIKEKFRLDKVEITLVMEDMGSALPPSSLTVGPDMFYPKPSMTSCPFPRNDEVNDCNPLAFYRTYDGSCNNLQHPLWGKSFRAVGRFLQPDYADGIGELRRAKSGRPLPSARAVSATLFTPAPEHSESHVHTVMMMTLGQFLSHDLIRTAVTKLSKDDSGTGEQVDVMCGKSECETEGAENRACEPIPVLRGDRDFTNKTCLMFVRTQEVMRDNCELAPREQLNQLTSWLDASMVYGSTKNESNALRDKNRPMRGQMATIRHPYESAYYDLLPQKENKDCRDLNNTVQCFTAGDGRVNEQIGLIAIHTIFARAHNTIEEELHHLNPHWDGERLFQETRRIIEALWQVIIYQEYLPLVLGPDHMRRHGLILEKNGYWDGYSPETNPDVTNAFGTAAFRFGHSQIGDVIKLNNQMYRRSKELDFSTVLRRPATIYETRLPAGSAVDSIILGMVSQAAEEVDTHFSKEMTVRLFSENPPSEPGLDLPAINTQRGRDHGIPGYNYWRDWCGLSRARTFDELEDVDYETRLKLRELYEDVDDMDLFVVGVTERHVPGGIVGPVFACIIARQFRALRVADRYWHERPDPNVRFTPDQLEEIRKYTLALLICDNTDRVDDIQKLVMMQPLSQAVKTLGPHNYMEAYNIASLYHGENNERHPCSHLPRPDLSKWRETPYRG